MPDNRIPYTGEGFAIVKEASDRVWDAIPAHKKREMAERLAPMLAEIMAMSNDEIINLVDWIGNRSMSHQMQVYVGGADERN